MKRKISLKNPLDEIINIMKNNNLFFCIEDGVEKISEYPFGIGVHIKKGMVTAETLSKIREKYEK